jgi:hypothetical protein
MGRVVEVSMPADGSAAFASAEVPPPHPESRKPSAAIPEIIVNVFIIFTLINLH